MLPILLPGEEPKSLILPVVDMRNDEGATERSSVVVLPIQWRGIGSSIRRILGKKIIVAPVICIEVFIAEYLVQVAVISVGAALGVKAFNSTGRLAELGGNRRRQDFKFAKRVDRRSSLVE